MEALDSLAAAAASVIETMIHTASLREQLNAGIEHRTGLPGLEGERRGAGAEARPGRHRRVITRSMIM